MSEAKLMQGNEACVEGALAAGVRFFAGYPITPSTEIAEEMARRLPQLGGVFIQMEDEIASIGAGIGAAMAGKKSLTASSGPGISLKQEFIGYACIAEIPIVIVDVQRMGPSIGIATSPSQGDVMQSRWGTHGDHSLIVLSSWSVRDTFDITVMGVNYAQKYRTPVILLLDEVIAHMREKIVLPDAGEIKVYEPKEDKDTEVKNEKYKPYSYDSDNLKSIFQVGNGDKVHVTGLIHDENGFPSSDSNTAEKEIMYLQDKINKAKNDIIHYHEYFLEDAKYVVVAYGVTARVVYDAVKKVRNKGIKAGMIRLVTIWPFADECIKEAAKKAKKILVPEMNCGQLVSEVERVAGKYCEVVSITKCNTKVFLVEEICDAIINFDSEVIR